MYRDRLNPFEYYTDEEFIRRYRFSKDTTHRIVEIVGPNVAKVTKRNHVLPVHIQITCALQYYATGTFQQTVGDTLRISQPTMSRVIKDVSIAIAMLSPRYIKYPRNQGELSNEFQQIQGFPQVNVYS